MPRLILRDATVLDADGARPRTTVVVEDRRIATVRTADGIESGPEDRVVDLDGRTVMPGMVSSHFHATYHELGSKTAPFGLEEPPALQAVRAAHHLELLLRCGFTGAVSAGAPFAIDASMKAAIAEGLVAGPRLMAGSRDVSTTGHAGDKSFPWYWDVGARGAINRSDGPDEFRLAVREEIKQGAEIIKMFVTGGHGTVAPSEQTEMTREEITAGIEAAHQRGALVRGHIANREAIHMALDAGIDVVDHGDGLDALAIERMVELGTFLVPSQLFPVRFAEMMGGGGLGFTAAMADGHRAGARHPAQGQRGRGEAPVRRRLRRHQPAARPLRRRARVLREGGGDPAPRRDPLGHPQRRRAHGPVPRAGLGAGGLPGRPARGRRRPPGRHRAPAGPGQAAGRPEGRHAREGRPRRRSPPAEDAATLRP